MFTIKSRAGAMVALGVTVGFSGTVLAAAPHGHESHGAPTVELTLNNGQKWQTDEALRTEMELWWILGDRPIRRRFVMASE